MRSANGKTVERLRIPGRRSALVCGLLVTAFSACGQSGDAPATPGKPSGSGAAPTSTDPRFAIESPAFDRGEAIPRKYTADGADVSPPLRWSDAPEGTRSFALICEDPDAPAGNWVHWVIYNIPASATQLQEDVPKKETLASGALQGKNDFRKIGYGGPSPPAGRPHRYYFRLYALGATLDLGPGARKKDVERAMSGHILAQTELMGMYGR